MTVRRSPRGKWMIDINYNHPDGTTSRIRKVSPVQSRRGAELHERELRLLLQAGVLKEDDEDEEGELGSTRTTRASKVSEFVEVFLDEHSRTEGLRPRYIRGQESALEQHVVPVIGDERMDEIGTKHFGLIKRAMLKKSDYSGKTVNNVLGVLSKMVRFWWEREGLDAPHFRVGLLKLDEQEAAVYDREVYDRLVVGAGECGLEELAMVLLMGDGGLRQGELRGLHRADLHFEPKPVIRIQRALSLDGEEHTPKSRRNRTVPMTSRLAAALREYIGKGRKVGPYVFVREDGLPLTASAVRARVRRAERQAGIEGKGRSHVMRHTFVTHLAESNASPRVIQELAGHTELKTTMRYMHMRNDAAHEAIAALEGDRSRAQQESAQTRRSQRHHSGTALEP